VTIDSHIAYLLVGAMFLTQTTMFLLQFSASRRHRQRSFVLLWIGTICSILDLVLNIVPIRLRIDSDMVVPLFYVSSLLLVAQMILTVWGTSELFRAYRRLDSQVASAVGTKT
jgi:hypothetical protein